MAAHSIKSTRLLFIRGMDPHEKVRNFLLSLGSSHYKTFIVVAIMTYCYGKMNTDIESDSDGNYSPRYRKDGTIGFDDFGGFVNDCIYKEEIIGEPVIRKKGVCDWNTNKYYEPFYINWGCKNKEDMFCYSFLESFGNNATHVVVALLILYYAKITESGNFYQFPKRVRPLPVGNRKKEDKPVKGTNQKTTSETSIRNGSSYMNKLKGNGF